MATVIVVSGAPASGKSVLSNWFAGQLGLQLLSKDSIKETLFDELGCESRGQSIELGKVSFGALVDGCHRRVLALESFIVESAFRRQDGPMLAALFPRYRILHVHCVASTQTLITRFKQRSQSAERHWGHLDRGNVEGLSNMLAEHCFDMLISGVVRNDIGTDDFSALSYSEARERVLHEYATNNLLTS